MLAVDWPLSVCRCTGERLAIKSLDFAAVGILFADELAAVL